jgi:hypothetical protein
MSDSSSAGSSDDSPARNFIPRPDDPTSSAKDLLRLASDADTDNTDGAGLDVDQSVESLDDDSNDLDIDDGEANVERLRRVDVLLGLSKSVLQEKCRELKIPICGNKGPLASRIAEAEENLKSKTAEDADAQTGTGFTEVESEIMLNAIHSNKAMDVCQDKNDQLVS